MISRRSTHTEVYVVGQPEEAGWWGKITAKMPNTHTHGSKQGTISEKGHTVSGFGFALSFVSDSLQKTKTLVVEGKNFNSRLPLSRYKKTDAALSIRFPLGVCCLTTAQFLRRKAY